MSTFRRLGSALLIVGAGLVFGGSYALGVGGAPTVSSVAPVNGYTTGGTAVTITGTNFTGTVGVKFGTYAAQFNAVSDTQVQATAPAQGGGTVDVTVTTVVGTSSTSAASKFNYVVPANVSAVLTDVQGNAQQYAQVSQDAAWFACGALVAVVAAVAFAPLLHRT